jgi:hypothetical protein
VTLAGQVIVGGAVSRTVTENEQDCPVSEVETTDCVPTGKNEPEAGLFDTAPQFPVTDAAAKLTNAPGCPPCVVLAVTTTLAGQSSTQISVVVLWTRGAAVEELLSLLGSGVVLVTVAVLEIAVPDGVPPATS